MADEPANEVVAEGIDREAARLIHRARPAALVDHDRADRLRLDREAGEERVVGREHDIGRSDLGPVPLLQAGIEEGAAPVYRCTGRSVRGVLALQEQNL